MSRDAMTNWAGNHVYAGELVRPASLAQAADVVARSAKVRALGTRHSFNEVADSAGTLVSLDRLAYRHPDLQQADDAGTVPPSGNDDAAHPGGAEPQLDPLTGHVRVPAATRYADLARFLDQHGRTLANFASLPHIGIAGAISTGTHGSGVNRAGLASAVVGLELIGPGGGDVTLHRDTDGDTLNGATVSLGAIGLVHTVTLETVPAFDVAQTLYGPVPFAAVADAFDEVSALAYSVSCFATLRGPEFDTVWLKTGPQDGPAPAELLGAPALTEQTHPIPGVDPANCTAQLGLPGPAADRLPHFRADQLPSAGAEIQCEYLIPRHSARLALRALADLAGPLSGLLQVCEVRSVAADLAWLSPAYGTPSIAVHFTLVRDAARVAAVLPTLEEAFGTLGGRPHWGKVFAADPARVRARYPRRADFVDLARTLDPGRKFTNDFVDRWVG